MMVLKNMFKKVKNEKDGFESIESVIGCVVFLIAICFFIDLISLFLQFSVVSQESSYLARTVGIQGGVLSSTPYGYPGGSTEYVNSSQMSAVIKTALANAGLSENDYTITITDKDTGNTESLDNNSLSMDYQTNITTTIMFKHKWTFISNWIPGLSTVNYKTTRTVKSEFKYRYDSWYGEE